MHFAQLPEHITIIIFEAVGIARETPASDVACVEEAEWYGTASSLTLDGAPSPWVAAGSANFTAHVAQLLCSKPKRL